MTNGNIPRFNKTIAATFAVGLLLGGVVGAILAYLFISPAYDSPVDVGGGGSIHGKVYSSNKWKQITPGKFYTALSNDKSLLTPTSTVVLGPGSTAPPLTSLSAWLVTISTRDANGGTDPYTISFCSDPTQPPGFPTHDGPYCSGTSGTAGTVYLQTNGADDVWKINSNQDLKFQNNHAGCTNSTGSPQDCDVITQITITTIDTSGKQGTGTYTCTDQKTCYVRSGK